MADRINLTELRFECEAWIDTGTDSALWGPRVVLALVEAVESDIAVQAAMAASVAAWREVGYAPKLGSQKRQDALEAAFAADKVYVATRAWHRFAVDRFTEDAALAPFAAEPQEETGR